MGSRLDATNANISLEHQEYLGKTLLDIAGEKGGIIKKGVDVVTAVTHPPVGRTLEAIAAERGDPLWRVGKDMRYRPNPGRS